MGDHNQNIQAASNKSEVHGKIIHVSEDKDVDAYVYDVNVTLSVDVGKLPNFTRARVGKTIKIYAPCEDGRRYGVGETVKFVVSFQGDEKGGIFFVSGN